MNQSSCFVTTIDSSLFHRLKTDLEEQGFLLTQPNYTVFQGKKPGVSCTLYESGKFVVQGKNMHDFISYYLEPEILKTFSHTYPKEVEVNTKPHIGVDEAGKGDVFGPLCVAAVYANNQDIEKLQQLGVKDSKTTKDAKILQLAKAIKRDFIHSIIPIFPKRYNELYKQFNNLNHLLAWGHATAIENVVNESHCSNVLIDQFAAEYVVKNALKKKSLEVSLTQRHRGEEDIVVAAASILARAAFVEGIENLSKEFNMTLPKGASKAVRLAGSRFIAIHGKDNLHQVSKLHFKTIATF